MLISVLIDTYNHEGFLREALDSVLCQEGLGLHEMEIIVVDDGSTDATPALVKTYGDRVKYVRKNNGGQASAFNMGIRLCRGELIAFLDGDDWWHPMKLASVLGAFESDPGLVAVGHGIFEVDQVAGRTYEVTPGHRLDLDFGSIEKARELTHSMAYLGTSRLTSRRGVLLSLLDVPEDLIFEADEYIFTLLPACGRVAVLPQCLTYYRIHGGNLFQGSRTERPTGMAVARLAARACIFACLEATLRPALSARGCSRQIVDVVMTPLEIEATRLRLHAFGGTRWENFRFQVRVARFAKQQPTLMDALILYVTLFLTLLVPPKRFFSIRSAYSRSTLRRVLRGSVPEDEKR